MSRSQIEVLERLCEDGVKSAGGSGRGEPERSKCLERANLRYDDYEKERDKAKPKVD